MNRYRLRVISPRAESPYGARIEVNGNAFAVLRVKHPDSAQAGEYSRIQEAIGIPLVILHPDQDLELVEIVEAEPKSGVEATA